MHALARRAASPYEGVRTALAARPRSAPAWRARQLEVGRGLANLRSAWRARAPRPRSTGRSGRIAAGIGRARRLADVKRIREAHGGTINDVVLAAITGGFRELLLAAVRRSRAGSMRTLVPVSVRAEHERGTYDNKVSAMFAELPVAIEDPVTRLESITSRCRSSSTRARRSRPNG